MCVDVSGGRKGAVPQPFLNLLHRYAVHHHQAGAAVAQIVETDVLQPVLGQQPVEVLRHEVRADQLAFLIGADEIQILGAVTLLEQLAVKLLFFLLLQKFFFHSWDQRQSTAAGLVLHHIADHRNVLAVHQLFRYLVIDGDTLINRNKKSSINKYLDNIKNGASSSIYLQVTGTPQAILLQTQVSGWHPYFTYYFAPGNSYLGGDFFFPKEKPDCITFIENLKTPAHDVVLRHLAVSALVELGGGKVSNCLVHPSVRQASHDIFARDISKELQWCKEHIDDEFKAEFTAVYDGLAPVKYSKASVSDAFGKAKDLLTSNAVKILIMNGKNAISSDQYSTGANIVIGGNTLGRGVTFPSLHTIYYTRTAKKPQADTMWQHSRMFGYDRDPGLMMVYIDEPLYKLFSDINATNNSLIAQVESGTDHIKVYYPNGLKPTRSNVLDERHVATISGGTNYYPFYPGNNTIAQLDAILAPFAEDEPVYQVSLRLMKEILLHITSEDDFRVASFISIIEMMLSEKPNAQGILIVRRNRDVAQGTGALLSPNDWALGGQYTASAVLTMYKVTGRKGWGGQELWVPNIKLPSDLIYYDVQEDESST